MLGLCQFCRNRTAIDSKRNVPNRRDNDGENGRHNKPTSLHCCHGTVIGGIYIQFIKYAATNHNVDCVVQI